MKKLDPIQYLTGFLMGAFFGFFAEGILMIFCSLLYKWLGRAHLELAWWMTLLLFPVPLFLGVIVGKAIASMHLEDY
jgi:hypothetical protein